MIPNFDLVAGVMKNIYIYIYVKVTFQVEI